MPQLPPGKIYINNRQDMEIVREIFTENQYGIDTRIKLEGTVLDVGAHIGLFSRLALERGCQVVSVEPEAKNFERLIQNAPEAIHINKAVTSKKEAYLNVHPDRGELHQLSSSGVKVKTTTLDQLIDVYGPFDLLKMDIEGGEYDAFWSCKRLDEIKQITMEYHLGLPLALELCRFLVKKGFKPVYMSGEEFGQLQLVRV